MFGWLKRKLQITAIRTMEQDLARFVSGLKGASGPEIGLVVAVAAHWRHILENEYAWDLSQPDFVMARQPEATMILNKAIRDVQKSNPAMAAGLMVWLHSLRASNTPEIRLQGRQMWAELARGFPYAEEAAFGFYTLTGSHLEIYSSKEIPDNLRPFDALP